MALAGNVASSKAQPPALALAWPRAAPPQPRSPLARPPPMALSIGGSGMSGTASLTCTGAPTGRCVLCSRDGFAKRVLRLYLQRQRHHNFPLPTRVLSPWLGTLALGYGNFRKSNPFQMQHRPINSHYHVCASRLP